MYPKMKRKNTSAGKRLEVFVALLCVIALILGIIVIVAATMSFLPNFPSIEDNQGWMLIDGIALVLACVAGLLGVIQLSSWLLLAAIALYVFMLGGLTAEVATILTVTGAPSLELLGSDCEIEAKETSIKVLATVATVTAILYILVLILLICLIVLVANLLKRQSKHRIENKTRRVIRNMGIVFDKEEQGKYFGIKNASTSGWSWTSDVPEETHPNPTENYVHGSKPKYVSKIVLDDNPSSLYSLLKARPQRFQTHVALAPEPTAPYKTPIGGNYGDARSMAMPGNEQMSNRSPAADGSFLDVFKRRIYPRLPRQAVPTPTSSLAPKCSNCSVLN